MSTDGQRIRPKWRRKFQSPERVLKRYRQQTDKQTTDRRTGDSIFHSFIPFIWIRYKPIVKRNKQVTQKQTHTDRAIGRQTNTRNSSGDEIANVNFLYDDIVHVIQNTIDSCINSATARRGGYVLERMFTKFSEITQCNGHYAVQGHSRSPILAPIESSYTTSY